MNRKLRLGMVGGGIGGHMGLVHRAASLMDGRFDLVAGSFSSNYARGIDSAERWLIPSERTYASYQEMIQRELARKDRIDAVSVVTPNELHFSACMAFLQAGINVFCENPVCSTSEQIAALTSAAVKSDCLFAVGFGYSAYPMVRLARDLVHSGEIGDVRSILLEYVSEYETILKSINHWRNDSSQAGPLGSMADIGSHAVYLGNYISGVSVSEVAADLHTFVHDRNLDDYGSVLLRFGEGVRGCLICTSAAPGNENSIRVRVNGSLGAVDWHQEQPNHLKVSKYGQPSCLYTRGGHIQTPTSRASTRLPKGHPEGFIEAYGNLYSEFADAIEEGQSMRADFTFSFPSLKEAGMSVRFMEGVVASNRANSAWVCISDPS